MSHIHTARLIIETTSPLAIYSGARESGFDNQLARDANGLPYIPATSIAGVWRQLVKKQLSATIEQQWFGFTGNTNANTNDKTNTSLSNNGHSSKITISNGIVHNSQNKPVVGLQTNENLSSDKLLALLQQAKPLHRERVKINDRGVATDGAKFDQLMLPSGVRFCIDLKIDDSQFSGFCQDTWQQLLACFHLTEFALGATTRNGLGQFKVVGSKVHSISLHNNPDASCEITTFVTRKNIPTTNEITNNISETPYAILPLKGLDNWRCGQGTERLGSAQPEQKINMLTYSEKRILWVNNQANINTKPTAIMCGSSIKGILAHRVAYHLRRHQQVWAEDMADCNHEQWQIMPEGLAELFGYADPENHDNSFAGKLIIEDSEVNNSEKNIIVRTHNRIDRFTGGVMKGALFSEELIYQPEFTLKIWLKGNTKLSPTLKKALDNTLQDLQQGMLPMGAGSGRGTSLVMQNPEQEWIINHSLIQTLENTVTKQEPSHEH